MRLWPRDDSHEEGVRSQWHRLEGLRIHSRRSDQRPRHAGPPIVCVHGQVVSSRYMTPLIQRMGARFPTVAPDLPGFGRSDKPNKVLTIRELADVLAHWMRAALGRPAVLLGNSLGCQIAVECAVRHPETVQALVLQGPTADPRLRSPGRAALANTLNTFRESSVGIGPLLDYLQAGPWRAIRTAQYLLADRIEKKLPQIHQPALVVRGAKDLNVSQGWAEEVTRLLPRGELRVIPGAAHTMVAVGALELVRVATPFLLSLDERAEKGAS
ncbi:alpha/beta fold hydrolase [Plastorhodobacter daqingensis]|uniref:Alpha/beta fold hydrolase n=1 Tax=Plastorhodobacter daqingensis TaxID=1387281 RepID=A0ABW2UNN9_9RHOB